MDVTYNSQTGEVTITKQNIIKLENLKKIKAGLEKTIQDAQTKLIEINEIISQAV